MGAPGMSGPSVTRRPPCSAEKKQKISGALRRLPVGIPARRAIMRRYQRKALALVRVFSLTEPQFFALIGAPCVYCGAPPAQEFGLRTPADRIVYNGVDQREPGRGYTCGNAVSCCWTCNKAKSGMTPQEFLAWARKVVEKNQATPLAQSGLGA